MNKSIGLVFTENANLYDKVRPHYPDELFADLRKHAHLDKSSSILEVGAGTGQATTGLLSISKQLTCIEPGKEMYAILKTKFLDIASFNTTFEAYDAKEKFDAIVSATAWHWVGPIKYKKAHRLLADNGSLVILRHFHIEDDPSSFHVRANDIYGRIQESPPRKIHKGSRAGLEDVVSDINNSYFEVVKRLEYPWQDSMSVDEYIDLRNTYYEILLLSPAKKNKFEKEVRDLAKTEFGGKVVVNYITLMVVAKSSP